MKKCIIIPDSFKGTMSSVEVCEIMKKAVLDNYPQCEVITVPVADGGEGTVDCFLYALRDGRKVIANVNGPYMKEIQSFYGIAGDTAIIETAAAAGIMLTEKNPDPSATSTFGAGQLLLDALDKGCNKIIIGLGGSGTNDAGAGMAAALGTRFYNKYGETFIPVGANLGEVVRIDNTEAIEMLKGIQITAMCDVDNPLFGKNGAAYVFAPQKGADPAMVELLDNNLRRFSDTIKDSLNIDVSGLKGGGAAGGMGAGLYAFLGARLMRGIDTVLSLVEYDRLLDGCDCVFTGEGKLDKQSFGGKVVIEIGKRASLKNVPVIAVVGSKEKDTDDVYNFGIKYVVTTAVPGQSFESIKNKCREDLYSSINNFIKKLNL